MWCELKTRISSANIDALLQRAKPHLSTTDSTEVVSSGKDFFGGDNAESASFTLLIPEDTAAEMAKSMQPVTMAKGNAIVFDSFEPHMSSANNSDKPRLGMKIACGEGTGRQYYMMSVDELESS